MRFYSFSHCRSQSTERLSPSHSGVSGNAGWRRHLCVKPSASLPLSAAPLGHVASSAKKPHTPCSGSPEQRVTNADGLWFIHSTGMKHTPYRRQPCRQSAFPFGTGYYRKRSRSVTRLSSLRSSLSMAVVIYGHTVLLWSPAGNCIAVKL